MEQEKGKRIRTHSGLDCAKQTETSPSARGLLMTIWTNEVDLGLLSRETVEADAGWEEGYAKALMDGIQRGGRLGES